MGLTQKILLFTGLLVVALVATSLGFATFESERIAREVITQALGETREVWQTYEADRYAKLKLGIRVLANDAHFKAAVVETDQATILDTLQERGRDMKADFLVATDEAGQVVARTDRPREHGQDLSKDPIIRSPLEGEEASTVWRQGELLFHAVAVPMQTGPTLVGSLVAGYAINDVLAGQLRKLTRSEIAFLVMSGETAPRLAASSLGPSEGALRDALAKGSLAPVGNETFGVDLMGDRHLGIAIPLHAAGGTLVGQVLALRSVSAETAAFRRLRNSLILVSLGMMALALAVAAYSARRITGPVRSLVGLVERARDGSYAGRVAVSTSDEIGILATAFNALLADLREKNQMIAFLRDGLTIARGGVAADRSVPGDTGVRSATGAGTPSPRGDRLERGTVFAERYEIQGTLGRGGMGVVYRAHDRQIDEVVALKVLRAEALAEDETLLERFKQELKLARRITHRNILRTHDFGEAAGVPFISMEYVEGVSLKDLLRSRGALPLAVGLSVAKQMCHGLEAAHQQGVIHRDIKPHNMLILPETGELKIMDFGIARVSAVEAEAKGLTRAGAVMGTPDYIPPEQAQGQPADFRSDLYSLGVVLFESFTGVLPFRGDTAMAVILAHVQTPPPAPRSLNPQLPPELEAIVLRCLEKSPARRFQRVGEMLEALTTLSARLAAD
jgi:HAMP domain-containing protein